MFVSTARVRTLLLTILLSATTLLFPRAALANDDGNVLFLSEYLHGDYYYARLGDIDGAAPAAIRPRKLRLGSRFRARVELGNHDVSYDGKTIVFSARKTSDYDWNIYTGSIDLAKRRIRKVRRIIRNVGMRDEDPRFSWTGEQIVYKCGGNICIYPEGVYTNPVVQSWCELWAPSFDLSGYRITFTKRCDDANDDRTWQFDLSTGAETPLPVTAGSTNRFPQFLDDGRILYSRLDIDAGRSSLWVHDSGYLMPFHDRTQSDDDPYQDKHDGNHIAFIGWGETGYDLYVYRQSLGDSVRLSYGVPILAPVLFR